ncbi:hypothetical protein CVT24_012947 [Panaeolus cyanescens]|uniref:Uncharacterized protein n=1 Tax=Panaeolus cyanescens TaxID=181874 RepID=A0A409W6D4_9AGAR|nr:hypothetical protein CVT24_012947 [Panaeolus cyanescens]
MKTTTLSTLLLLATAAPIPTLANWDIVQDSTTTITCSGASGCTCTGATTALTDGDHLTDICTRIFTDPCKAYNIGTLSWSPSTRTPCSVYYKPRSVDECKQAYNTGFNQWHTGSDDCAGASSVYMLGFVKALNGVIGSGGTCLLRR